MRPSIAQLRQWYDHYNTLIFGGQLSQYPIGHSTSSRRLGETICRQTVDRGGNIIRKVEGIRISIRFDVSEEHYINTLVHEMIHCFIFEKGLKDDSSHGAIFTRMMNQINSKYGLQIQSSHQLDDEMVMNDIPKQRYFCILSFKNGRTGLIVAAKSKIFDFWDALERIEEITCSWYTTMNSYLGKYPASVSLSRYVILDNEELHKVMTGALLLKRSGDTISVIE